MKSLDQRIKEFTLEINLLGQHFYPEDIYELFDESTRSLDLSELDLEVLPLHGLEILRVKSLDISLNPKINIKGLHNVHTINELNFSYCELDEIPDEVNLLKLQSLSLRGNQLENINEIQLKEIKILDIGENEISELAIDSNNLKEIYLDFNILNKLSLNTPYLEILNISNCQLQDFPSITLSRIKELDISYTKFVLPSLCINSLEYLNLAGIDLVDIPILECPNLEVLILKDNKLNSIPSRLLELTNLKELNIQGNSIKMEHSSQNVLDLLVKNNVSVIGTQYL